MILVSLTQLCRSVVAQHKWDERGDHACNPSIAKGASEQKGQLADVEYRFSLFNRSF